MTVAVTHTEPDGPAEDDLPTDVDELAAYRGRSRMPASPVVAPPGQDHAGPHHSGASPIPMVHAGQGVLDLPGVAAVPAVDAAGGAAAATSLQPEMRRTDAAPPGIDPSERVMLLRPRVEERVIRRVRLGPVFRMALGLFICAYIVILGAATVLWFAADALDMITGIEGFVEDLGFENFEFHPDAMFRAAAIGGALLVVAGTFLAVLAAEVFNLLTVMTGGLRAVVGPPLPKRRRIRGMLNALRRRAAQP